METHLKWGLQSGDELNHNDFAVWDWKIFARVWRAEAEIHGRRDPGSMWGHNYDPEPRWSVWVAKFKASGKRTYPGWKFRVTPRMKEMAPADWVNYQCLKMLQEYKRGRLRKHLRSRNKAKSRVIKLEFVSESYTRRRP
jgi:hypothetical protein